MFSGIEAGAFIDAIRVIRESRDERSDLSRLVDMLGIGEDSVRAAVWALAREGFVLIEGDGARLGVAVDPRELSR